MRANPVTVNESPTPYSCTITTGPHTLSADEPESLGGRNTGPTPLELAMSALGACTAITLRMYLQRKGWNLAPLTVSVTATESAGRWTFTRAITSNTPLTPQQQTKLLEIADKCPVHKLLEGSSTITTQLTTP